jgi:hypothetical protein
MALLFRTSHLGPCVIDTVIFVYVDFLCSAEQERERPGQLKTKGFFRFSPKQSKETTLAG